MIARDLIASAHIHRGEAETVLANGAGCGSCLALCPWR